MGRVIDRPLTVGELVTLIDYENWNGEGDPPVLDGKIIATDEADHLDPGEVVIEWSHNHVRSIEDTTRLNEVT